MSKRLVLQSAVSITALALMAGYAACGGSSETADGTGGGNPGSGGAGAAGGDGGSTGTFVGTGTSSGGAGGDENCASVEQEATLTSRPVDIIIVIDNSGSMNGEIEEVEVQLTQNFATILDSAMPAIDYRVIMVAEHGPFNSAEICISQPLGPHVDADGDGHCDDPDGDGVQDNPPKFYHHNRNVRSHDALCQLYDAFDSADDGAAPIHPNGYSEFLRDDSYKFFLVITDDNVDDTCDAGQTYDDNNSSVAEGIAVADAWDADMLALSPLHFGADTDNRNYTFWSIVSLVEYMPGADPWGDPHPPDVTLAPITTAECAAGAVRSGTGYQALSVLTGGYRFPTCPADGSANPPGDYSKLFTLMAQGVIDGAQVDCEIQIPDPPPGQTVDLNTLQVVYSSNGSVVESFQRVDTAADCNATSFYIDNNTIILCPEACTTVQSDENAKLAVSYDCGGPPS